MAESKIKRVIANFSQAIKTFEGRRKDSHYALGAVKMTEGGGYVGSMAFFAAGPLSKVAIADMILKSAIGDLEAKIAAGERDEGVMTMLKDANEAVAIFDFKTPEGGVN